MSNSPDVSPFSDDVDRQIAHMVIEGAPNKVIATRTGLPLGTVKWRLHRMYRRLEVHSRTTFAMAARDLLGSS